MGKFKESLKLKEVIIAIILSFLVSTVLLIISSYYEKVSGIYSNYSTFVSFSASFIGFLITAFTIMVAFPEEGKIAILKKSEGYPELFYLFIVSIISQVIVFIVSFTGLLFNLTDLIFSWLMITTIILSISFLILIVWILKKMLDLHFDKLD